MENDDVVDLCVSPLGKVLVIDDDPDVVEILTSMLADENVVTQGVTDAALALAVIAEFKPHAIFTDLKMPQVDGLDLVRSIRELYPEMPVVIVSGEVDKQALLAAVRLGVTAVIEKPFGSAQVRAQFHAQFQK